VSDGAEWVEVSEMFGSGCKPSIIVLSRPGEAMVEASFRAMRRYGSRDELNVQNGILG